MLSVQPKILESVRSAASAEDLYEHLQAAIELEHATIPPYLTSLFSIKPGMNTAAHSVIGSVVVQEMLHLTIACNILNAIGGSPVLDKPGFIPVYPGPLPMGVRSGLVVGLEKLSRTLVYEVFMSIEEPEQPLDIPVKQLEARLAALAPEPSPGFATIGDFYAAIAAKITELGNGIFTGDPSRQVVDPTWFPPDQLFAVHDVATATQAIQVIVEQGEGTPTSPEEEGEPAHYYRFAQLVYARMLVRDPTTATGWAYAGAGLGIDPAGVWNLLPNAKAADYPVGSRARYVADQFNGSYTNLLRALHTTFNGDPASLKSAMGLMSELHILGHTMAALPIDGTPYYASPTFEYTPA